MMQPDRVEEVRARYLARGAEADLPADFTGDLFELLIAATCKAGGRADGAERPRGDGSEGRRVSAALPPGPADAAGAAGGRLDAAPAALPGAAASARYGDTFTLRIRHWGDWVLLCDPDDVKKVFTAGDRGRRRRRQPAAGAGARPALGDAAGRTRAHDPPQADAARLPRQERSRADAEMMAEVARREVAPLAGRRAVRALAADAGDHPGGGDAGRLRRRRRTRASAACASC